MRSTAGPMRVNKISPPGVSPGHARLYYPFILLFFNKFILTFKLTHGRIAPKGAIAMTPSPASRFGGFASGHFVVTTLCACLLRSLARHPHDVSLCPGWLDSIFSPPVGTTHAPGWDKGHPLSRSAGLGLGFGGLAAVCVRCDLAPRRVRRQPDASVHLLSGFPLLPADADRSPKRSGLYHSDLFSAVVRSYVSGGPAAAAALLSGVSAAPPRKEDTP